MAPLLNHENIGAVQKIAYLTATITSVDSANDTACFEGVGRCPSGIDVIIFYHCEPDSALRDNGALEGAAGAFSVDDEVIVQCEITGANQYVPLRVMGFTDKPKMCCPSFYEPWGDTLCENYDGWQFTWSGGHPECEIPPTGVILANGVLSVSVFNNNGHVLSKYYDFIPVEADLAPRKVRIKITANASGGDPMLSYVALFMRFYPRQFVQLMFAINHWDPTQWAYPPTVYVGDNGGEEQIITLSDHFTIPEDSTLAGLEFYCMSNDAGHSASFDLDYIEISGECLWW